MPCDHSNMIGVHGLMPGREVIRCLTCKQFLSIDDVPADVDHVIAFERCDDLCFDGCASPEQRASAFIAVGASVALVVFVALLLIGSCNG